MKRFFQRIIFHSARLAIKPLDGRFSRLYMTFYNRLLASMGVKMKGAPRYISGAVKFDDFDRVTLSERVVISANVILLTHDYSVTTGLIALGRTPETDIAFIRDIEIGNNVFIGMGSILLPGVNIGDNCIIGAGSVVRGAIPSDSIVMGNPAQVIANLSEKALKWEASLERGAGRSD